MVDETYLYHYYPLNNINKLANIKNIEKKSIKLLLSESNHGNPENAPSPFRDLYHLDFLLGDGKIWLGKCENLNDPFEFLAYLHKDFFDQNTDDIFETYKKNPITKTEWYRNLQQEFKTISNPVPYKLSERIKYYGVYSLCKSPIESLMWSYYSSGHSGVCIRFRVHPYIEKAIRSGEMNITQYHSGPSLIFGPAVYDGKPFQLTAEAFENYKTEHLDLLPMFNEDIKLSVLDLINCRIVLGKHHQWAHEKEFRLISLGLTGGVQIKNLTIPNTHERILEADAVVFGLLTPGFAKQLIQSSFGKKISY